MGGEETERERETEGGEESEKVNSSVRPEVYL